MLCGRPSIVVVLRHVSCWRHQAWAKIIARKHKINTQVTSLPQFGGSLEDEGRGLVAATDSKSEARHKEIHQ